MNKKSRQSTSTIKKNVMTKIQTGEAKMHSRDYYLALSVLSTLVVLLLGLVTAYFMSVMTLWLRIQAAEGPAYGARRNLSTLVDAFPWWALLLGVVSLIIIVYFVRKVGGLYKLRLIYLIPAVVIVSLILGFAFSYSALPNTIKNQSPHAVCNSSDTNCNTTSKGYMHGRQMK